VKKPALICELPTIPFAASPALEPLMEIVTVFVPWSDTEKDNEGANAARAVCNVEMALLMAETNVTLTVAWKKGVSA
jgi:hypothetical protein